MFSLGAIACKFEEKVDEASLDESELFPQISKFIVSDKWFPIFVSKIVWDDFFFIKERKKIVLIEITHY